MQFDEYRFSLIETINLLDEMESKLFTSIINVGMKGAYKEVDPFFEVGDTYDFELSMFEEVGDQNLDRLNKLIKRISTCKTSLMNINAIKEDELNDYEIEDYE